MQRCFDNSGRFFQGDLRPAKRELRAAFGGRLRGYLGCMVSAQALYNADTKLLYPETVRANQPRLGRL